MTRGFAAGFIFGFAIWGLMFWYFSRKHKKDESKWEEDKGKLYSQIDNLYETLRKYDCFRY